MTGSVILQVDVLNTLTQKLKEQWLLDVDENTQIEQLFSIFEDEPEEGIASIGLIFIAEKLFIKIQGTMETVRIKQLIQGKFQVEPLDEYNLDKVKFKLGYPYLLQTIKLHK